MGVPPMVLVLKHFERSSKTTIASAKPFRRSFACAIAFSLREMPEYRHHGRDAHATVKSNHVRHASHDRCAVSDGDRVSVLQRVSRGEGGDAGWGAHHARDSVQ